MRNTDTKENINIENEGVKRRATGGSLQILIFDPPFGCRAYIIIYSQTCIYAGSIKYLFQL